MRHQPSDFERFAKDKTDGPAGAATTRDNSGVRIFPPAIYAAGVAAAFLLQWAWPLPFATGALVTVARVFGCLLVVLWLGLNIWALATFFRAGLTPNPSRPAKAITSQGPYRFTRNPMYLSLAFLQLGVAFLANSLWTLLFVIPVLYVVQRAVIDREEKYLTRKFGQEYLAYRQRVRRWL